LQISPQARHLHFDSLVIDTHVDTTQRLIYDKNFDMARRNDDGSVDIPRLREGGIGAVFFAVWTPGTVTGQAAVQRAVEQIDAIHRLIPAHSQDLSLAKSSADILAAHADRRIAILIAIEGGHLIANNLRSLQKFHQFGARYMTLTHGLNVEWADSSTDKPTHNGLTPFGAQVVLEMNRLAMMVDISHVSDKTFADVLAVSEAPVIATHSSCRTLCDSPRNLTDGMIRALAAKRGVIQINFHMGFLGGKFREVYKANPQLEKDIDRLADERCGENLACQMREASRITRDFVAEGRLPRVEWTEIIDHIDHVVQLVGPDRVGLGSDFDGANMPFGMEDASQFPKITDALLRKGYSESDIRKILGGNVLRLMQDVEAIARKMEETT
jgi:membrane dipeptidase